jgi:hypothetical protein
MIWFTWRQFRTQTWIALGALAVIAVTLVIAGRSVADAYDDANLAACHSDCATAVDSFLQQVKHGTSGAVYYVTFAMMYLVPALIGIFWGAPLIAKELEAGTHRLVWNQSVTRTRWLATKLAVVGGATAAMAGLLSWAVSAWASRIDHAADDRITPLVYSTRGIVPIGYALFALVLGVTLGMLIRRTVPAMAATLALYAAAVASMPLWVRAHLLPASEMTRQLDTSSLSELAITPDRGTMRVIGDESVPGAWVLSNETITHTGKVFTGPVDMQRCGPTKGPQECLDWIDSLGLRQRMSYQSASHFWPLQWIETGIFVALAATLAGFCFWWIRRRVI